jgi:RND family efflux transporter MFP subunit
MTITSSDDPAGWVVQAWASHEHASGRGDDADLVRADFIVRLLAQLQNCTDSTTACRMMANRLQQFLGCRQIAVGLCRGSRNRCRLRALSGVVRFDSHTAFVQALQDALEEAIDRNSVTIWPPRDESQEHTSMAHERLVSLLGAERVLSLPLSLDDDQLVAICLLIDAPEEDACALAGKYGTPIAGCLNAVQRNQRGVVGTLIGSAWNHCRSWRGGLLWAAFVILSLALLVPVPYRITCDSELQPVIRRFVVAPYDGTLEKSLVAPGDMVAAQDVLARMDEREIRWELASLNADLTRARKERDAALASHRTADAQLAKLEMKRLQLQIRLLEHRLENLAVRSPIDGIVVTGDLQKAEGAPLTIGQSLFEIAPLEHMVAEIYIPENEIAHVKQGMAVSIDLDGFPDKTISGAIERIHPRAEVVDDESVFVAELHLDNSDSLFRPGMNGQATLVSDRRRLGWVLFHKPWTSLRRALAW